VALRVDDTDGVRVRTTCVEGGRLSDHKGINLPGVHVSAPSLSEKDREDLRFALSLRADLIALSFVRAPEDLEDVHAVMDEVGARLAARLSRKPDVRPKPHAATFPAGSSVLAERAGRRTIGRAVAAIDVVGLVGKDDAAT